MARKRTFGTLMEKWWPPRWSSLRGVSNSAVAKSTVLIPLIGYLVLFNGEVVKYLNVVRELGGHEGAFVSYRLILIYLGLSAIAVAVSVYGFLCPIQVKYYGSAASYVQGDGPSLRGFVINDMTVKLSHDPVARVKLEELSRDMEYARQTRGVTNEDVERYRLENLHLYFDYLDTRYPFARKATLLFYVAGVLMLGIPSADVFGRVIWLSCKKITGY